VRQPERGDDEKGLLDLEAFICDLVSSFACGYKEKWKRESNDHFRTNVACIRNMPNFRDRPTFGFAQDYARVVVKALLVRACVSGAKRCDAKAEGCSLI
jgi:hypothetical protein